MHPLLGEVAPALPGLLEPLLALLTFAVALGIIALVSYIVVGIVQILDKTVGRLPGVGGYIRSGANAFESIITRALGSAVGTIDRDISFWWHALSVEVEWLGKQAEQMGGFALAIASLVSGNPNARARGWIAAAIHLALIPVTAIARRAEHAVTRLEHVVAHSVAQGVYPRLRSIEHEIGKVIQPEIVDVRKLARTAENDAQAAYDYAKANATTIAADTVFVGAVAASLGKLGLGWLRCTGVGSTGRALCGLGGLLEAILGDAILAFAVTDLCAFVDAAESAAMLIRPVLYDLVDAEEALIGCHGAVAPPKLSLPALQLPATNMGLPLAA